MKLNKLFYILFLFLLLFSPSYNVNSEEGRVVYINNNDEEKLYKIKLYNYEIKDLNKIENKLKIRKVILTKTGDFQYKYSIKSTDYNLSDVISHGYIEYLRKNSDEEDIVNNNLYVEYIIVLNKYYEIDKCLKKYKYKIVS